jgi:hypothetical protein
MPAETSIHGARQCLRLAWNMTIPYLCPELPNQQKEAPLPGEVPWSGSVALRNDFVSKLAFPIFLPGHYWSTPAERP